MLLDNIDEKKLTHNKFNSAFILSKFKNAHNFEDLMAPDLTSEEKKFLLEESAITGCCKLLRSRCIDGIDIDKRPIHLVDPSRKKYLIHTNGEWIGEKGGDTIVDGVLRKVKNFWMVNLEGESNEVLELKTSRMAEYLQESHKILPYVNDDFVIKNNFNLLKKQYRNAKVMIS
jgi:hypothetical protein